MCDWAFESEHDLVFNFSYRVNLNVAWPPHNE